VRWCRRPGQSAGGSLAAGIPSPLGISLDLRTMRGSRAATDPFKVAVVDPYWGVFVWRWPDDLSAGKGETFDNG
jgi:hypothetical protein